MEEYLTTRELAALLRIGERKVYDLAAGGDIPCSRATGKLLFPRREIEAWLERSASGPTTATRPAVVLGSHDPLLDWALRESRCGLATYFDSSLDGLERFVAGEGLAAGLHLFDADSDSWNRVAIEARCGAVSVVLVEWARRQRGIIVAAGSEKDFPALDALVGRSVVPRQAEAGSQVLLENRLRQAQVDPAAIRWTRAARSESDAVVEVAEGRAEATFGLALLAAQYRLGFVPIVEERFDLLVERRAWFEPPWQTLMNFCRSAVFTDHAATLTGYDLSGQFQVHYNAP